MTSNQSGSGVGQIHFEADNHFNGVKVFSATMINDRGQLGDKVTKWMRQNPALDVRDVYVTQSSDEAFHCIAITLFYVEPL